MYRIRPWKEKNFQFIHTVNTDSLEEVWESVRLNMRSYVVGYAIPNCPRDVGELTLIKHVGSSTEGYHCKVQSTAVWGYLFTKVEDHRGFNPRMYVLEIWEPDVEYSYPEEYWEDLEDYREGK